ncbi:hypothetical protein [Helicobacter anatolicus]|uniref:hypothetical protein n=1 Tax=Helicobacter anatolicus TaxID=2905874 RepID=UPI001E412B30|nr:hypothetical protein [Helicobacter anatolicus]MCE3038937.1 hypothetical protein [Helicobacter anatolicus]
MLKKKIQNIYHSIARKNYVKLDNMEEEFNGCWAIFYNLLIGSYHQFFIVSPRNIAAKRCARYIKNFSFVNLLKLIGVFVYNLIMIPIILAICICIQLPLYILKLIAPLLKIVGGLILALITIPLICLYIIAAPLYAIMCLFGVIGLFFSILS